jgi:hypothetical protein
MFFYQYHLHLEPEKTMRLPIILRRWMMERYIEQKEAENKAMESQQRRASRKSR